MENNNDNICVGIKACGLRCDKKALAGGNRCRVHAKTVFNNGPNKTEIMEQGYLHKREIRSLVNTFELRIDAAATDEEREDIEDDLKHHLKITRANHTRVIDLLYRKHRNEINRTGVDPDEEANRRHRERREAQRVAEEQRVLLLRQILVQEQLDEDNNNVPVERREMGLFAQDRQNVHTTRVVELTKEIVNRILKIPVPEEYRWNNNECSKTAGEIITMCKLTPKAAWQMTSKYCQDESIYDLGNGIYGKVLDGVWQYILNSEHKVELCKALKQEMEDNIGMCAQGNLSRLCNILAGYMEGVGPQESLAEILGRELAKIVNIPDMGDRVNAAIGIFKQNHVPDNEWEAWLDPLMDDSLADVTYEKENEKIKKVYIKYKQGNVLNASITIN